MVHTVDSLDKFIRNMRLEVGRTQPWRNYCKLSCKLIELAYIGESRLKCLSCVLFAYFFMSVDTFLVKEVIH